MALLHADTRDPQISSELDPDNREIRNGTEGTAQELTSSLPELEVLTRQPKSTVRRAKHRRSESITKFPPGLRLLPTVTTTYPVMAPKAGVPKPGPAKLFPKSGLDEWLEQAKLCRYLPESAMKQLCEIVKECLMEGEHTYHWNLYYMLTIALESNIQPVTSPVTICGDIHGQFYDLLELFRVAGGMPGETDVQAPTTKTTIINSEDLEPPEITNPALKKKIRSSDNVGEDDDDEEAHRGRPRTAGESSRAGS
jgi:hypothetical protein